MKKIGFIIVLAFAIVGCKSTTNEPTASREAKQIFRLTNNMTCASRNAGQKEYCNCFVDKLDEVTPPEVKQKIVSDRKAFQSEILAVMLDNREQLEVCDQYKTP
ncbi:hypothetical protein WNY77_03690 [Paraglaciecola mesophila]|jgi:hypothetical protein|uniref:Lipoprotein n=1 Tax=Paraglaciecola mesophila TaxID=197222 RepID=A0ABU9SRH4_9ALTE|nr:hypothetical protein [Paraglaciecola mesophila]|tara:strand:- start:1572 stop:1883 length:312 start_codon:yes stop_codon:yes gene_type:complete